VIVDIRLTRGQNPSNTARAYGISPLDPYVEWCWTPVVGPTTVALVRRVAALVDAGEASIPCADMGRLLGIQASDELTPSSPLTRTMRRAQQFGLAFWGPDQPGVYVTFGIFDQMPVLRARNLQRLPLLLRQRHAVTSSRPLPACSSGGG
jgi:hypothetical protein